MENIIRKNRWNINIRRKKLNGRKKRTTEKKIKRKTSYIPGRQRGERLKDVKIKDPNNDSLYAKPHTTKIKIDEI